MTTSKCIEPVTVAIAEGAFLMGGERANERPIHRVWVDAFALAQYPVTRREYALFVEDTGHPPAIFWDDPRFAHPDQPVVGPSWFDAVAYCRWLSTATGKAYRLPTEAEREKAARGGRAASTYPWGDELPAEHRGGREQPVDPVGTEGPNGYGLYDMAAGVHEWCADFYAADYYAASPDRNPQGPDNGQRRAARGGSWRHEIRFPRCAARSSLAPDKQFSDFGFRCALTLA